MNRTRPGAAATTLCACVAVLVLTGCTTGANDTAGSDGNSEARARLAGLYVGSSVIRTAEELLVSECMQRAGFQYEPELQQADTELPMDYSDDVDLAEREGYGLRDEKQRTDALLQNESKALPGTADGEALRLALFGSEDEVVTVDVAGLGVEAPGSGCLAEAQKRLYGSVKEAVTADELLSNVMQMQVDNAENQASVLDAFSKWRSCMEDRGYSGVESRNFGIGLAAASYDREPSARAFRNEVQIATDDAECDLSVGYTEVRARAENEAFAAFLDDNEQIVISVLEAQRDAQSNARKALG